MPAIPPVPNQSRPEPSLDFQLCLKFMSCTVPQARQSWPAVLLFLRNVGKSTLLNQTASQADPPYKHSENKRKGSPYERYPGLGALSTLQTLASRTTRSLVLQFRPATPRPTFQISFPSMIVPSP